MAGPKSENSEKDRRVYKAIRAAGAPRSLAEEGARDSISKRLVPASRRPDADATREKGG